MKTTEPLLEFLKKVAEDDALFEEFAALAAKHGFDLTELGDAELDTIAGGVASRAGADLAHAQQEKSAEALARAVDTIKPNDVSGLYKDTLRMMVSVQARQTQNVQAMTTV